MSYFNSPNDGSQRQRPLQKSMILPDNHQKQQQPIIQQRQQNQDYILYNPMKRSSIPVLQGIHQSSSSSAIHYSNVGYSQTPHPSTNISLSSQNINQPRTINTQDHYYPSYLNNIKQISSAGKHQGMTQSHILNIHKNQKVKNNQIKSNLQTDISQVDTISTKIIAQLSQKILPKLISQVKKQLNKQILDLKQQFEYLKAEIKQNNQKQQLFNSQIKNQTGNIINFNSNNINNINNINSKPKKQETDLKQLQKCYGIIQKKYNQLQFKINQNIINLYKDIQKISTKLQTDNKQKSFKISQIKSTLPPIMLQYKQSFIIKRNEIINSIDQIIINKYQYYIDRNGYLLDQQRRYLTDLRGNQIRLQQKHLKLLQQHKIINK